MAATTKLKPERVSAAYILVSVGQDTTHAVQTALPSHAGFPSIHQVQQHKQEESEGLRMHTTSTDLPIMDNSSDQSSDDEFHTFAEEVQGDKVAVVCLGALGDLSLGGLSDSRSGEVSELVTHVLHLVADPPTNLHFM